MFTALYYGMFCRDGRYHQPQDPGSIFGPHMSMGLPVKRRTVYFINAAESEFDNLFRKRGRSWVVRACCFVPNLLRSVVYEFVLGMWKRDSFLVDAPLSQRGRSQVEALERFLSIGGEKHVEIIKNCAVLFSSNLRRAIETLSGALPGHSTIHVLTSLQEVSSAPDSISLDSTEKMMHANSTIDPSQLEMKYCSGNKTIDTNGLRRMREFCDILFTQENPTVVVCGHAEYLRRLCVDFLPRALRPTATQRHLEQAGIVCFDMMQAETRRGRKYMIDPGSLKMVYGGYVQ